MENQVNPNFSERLRQLQFHFDLTNEALAEMVVQADSLTKDELYSRAKFYFASSFKDSKQVLRIDDKQAGELSGVGSIPFMSKRFAGSAATKGNITFMLTILVKDGRYKYEFTDFTHEAYRTNDYSRSLGLLTQSDVYGGSKIKMDQQTYTELKERASAASLLLVESLKKSMKTPKLSSDF